MSDETKNKPALEDNFAELEDILKECNVMLDTVEKKMQILNAKGELEDF